MAMHTQERLDADALKSTIEKYSSEFIIGAQGPDIWLYHSSLPWSNSEMCRITDEIGNIVHAERVNDFFASCLNTIRSNPYEEQQLAMISYVAGHLCHWALDSTAHPFIYYRTNGSTDETKYWHCRYEAMIDNYMMDPLKEEKRDCFPIKKLLNHDSLCEIAIQNLYYNALKEVWDIEIRDKYTHDALKDFKSVLSYTSKKGFLYGLVYVYETLTNNNWQFTSHFITGEKDDTRDILNLNHQIWFHPCDSSEVHHEDFLELVEASIDKAVTALELFSDALGNGEDEAFLKFIDNRNYETGLSHSEKMKYFDPIY